MSSKSGGTTVRLDDDRASLVVLDEYDSRATLVASIHGFYIRVNWDPTDGGNSFPLNLCEDYVQEKVGPTRLICSLPSRNPARC